VLQNLLGQREVHHARDSVGSAFNAIRRDPRVSKADCWKFVQTIEKRREVHGYQESRKKFA
jgi:hypothetical protein